MQKEKKAEVKRFKLQQRLEKQDPDRKHMLREANRFLTSLATINDPNRENENPPSDIVSVSFSNPLRKMKIH